MISKLPTVGALAGGVLVAAAASAQQDPGALGPRAVSTEDYGSFTTNIPGGLGDIATVEELAQVTYPTNLGSESFPLVLFLHGAHNTCYTSPTVGNPEGTSSLVWQAPPAPPCPPPELPIPSYQGYDYVARTLASYGMIVVSISANAINAAGDLQGFTERPLLIQHHLDKWVTFSTTGGAPFGTKFVGHVDLGRIAEIGHSRGGSAVLSHVSDTPPPGLRAVLSIEATSANGSINNTPLALLLGYCDGDQFRLPSVRHFDDSRYAVTSDTTPKYTFLGLGANHNYFNRIWTPGEFVGGTDDWLYYLDSQREDPQCRDVDPTTMVRNPSRLTASEQRSLGNAYIAAFLRKHLLGDSQFDEILNGGALPPPSVPTEDVFVGYMPGNLDRKDLNRFTASSESTTNTLGGLVACDGHPCSSTTILSATFCDGEACTPGTNRKAHFGDLTAMKLRWTSSGGRLSNGLPLFKRDVSNFSTLQLRIGVDFTEAPVQSLDLAQDLTIQVIDGAGRVKSVKASDYTNGLYYPPGELDHKAVVLNTLRIPLAAFSGIDRTNVNSVDLVMDQTTAGSLLITDLAFADEGISVAETSLVATSIQ